MTVVHTRKLKFLFDVILSLVVKSQIWSLFCPILKENHLSCDWPHFCEVILVMAEMKGICLMVGQVQ